MITLSKRLFYAIEAVLYITYNSGSAPFTGKDIAERQKMPPRYLEQMMQKLVRTGVLRGVRGPRGGYLLARERHHVTLAEICLALEEDNEPLSSMKLGNQVVLPLMEQLRESMYAQLGSVTLADLYHKAVQLKIAKSNEEHNDFAI